MKNILLFLSLSINLVIILIACSKNESSGDPKNGAQNEYARFTKTSGGITTEMGAGCAAQKPEMTYGTVSQMITNYKNNQWMLINGGMGISDARAACFDLDSLENYICNLKSLAAESGSTSLTDLGVRFYYAAYSNPAGAGITPSYARKHTLVMIPTYKNAMGNNVDFDPGLIDAGSGTPLPLSRVAPSTPAGKNVLVTTSIPAGSKIFAMDHPTLAPPPTAGMAF